MPTPTLKVDWAPSAFVQSVARVSIGGVAGGPDYIWVVAGLLNPGPPAHYSDFVDVRANLNLSQFAQLQLTIEPGSIRAVGIDRLQDVASTGDGEVLWVCLYNQFAQPSGSDVPLVVAGPFVVV